MYIVYSEEKNRRERLTSQVVNAGTKRVLADVSERLIHMHIGYLKKIVR